MNSRGFGSFVDGLVDGMDTGRRWTRQEEARRIMLEDRTIAREDRARRIAIEDEQMQWAREDRARANAEHDKKNEERDLISAFMADTQPDPAAPATPTPTPGPARAEMEPAMLSPRPDPRPSSPVARASRRDDGSNAPDARNPAMIPESARPPRADAPQVTDRGNSIERDFATDKPVVQRPPRADAPPSPPPKPEPKRGGIGAPVRSARVIPDDVSPSVAQTTAQGSEQDQDAQEAAAVQAGDNSPATDATTAVVEQAVRQIDLRTAPPETVVEVGNQAARSAWDRFYNEVAPRLRDHYINAGDVEKAREWQAFIEEESVQKGIYYWSRAQFAAAIGDDQGFVANLAAAKNSGAYFDDGYDMVAEGTGIVRDGAGNMVGARMTFRNQQTGETHTRVMDRAADFYALGIGFFGPEAAFEFFGQQVAAEQKLQTQVMELARERQIELDKQSFDLFRRAYEDLSASAVINGLTPEEIIQQAFGVVEAYQARRGGGSRPAYDPGQVPVAPQR